MEVVAPTMYANGWTFEGHVQSVLEALDNSPNIDFVIGSSMGGFASAVALSKRPDRQVNLVLLAPAVGIHDTWAETFGVTKMSQWRSAGTIAYFHRGLDRDIELPYEFWLGCESAAEVVVRHRCVILHGRQDEAVPLSNSLRLAERSPGVRGVIVTEDGHRLHRSFDQLGTIIRHLSADSIAEESGKIFHV